MGPSKLSPNEDFAIREALKQGQYRMARLLERQARGRWVERTLAREFEHLVWRRQGVDAFDPVNKVYYEILSGTDWNFAGHGRRMGDVLFRMIFF